jgi:hypothetical protein
MGGKALNKYGVFTERKDTSEFLRLGKSIQDTVTYGFLNLYSLSIDTAVVTCYHTKPNHGDLDLLVKITPDIANKNINFRNFIELMFLPQAIHNNGGVFSFDYQNFQVDFIPIREEKWEIAQTYYSYDPLGNIMGKTFHKFGLSYGWDGLFYKFRNFHGSISENILLTTDPRRIFDFGGYDYDRYLQGFETLEEIFNFAINSDNFDTEMFQMENLKSIDKKRNRKRGSYRLFLNYLKDNNINVRKNFEEDKSKYITPIDFFFPEIKLKEKLSELQRIDTQNKIISQKFNGDIVMSWLPNLQGKELGAAISKFKDALGDEYGEFILNSDYKAIQNRFMEVYSGKYQPE